MAYTILKRTSFSSLRSAAGGLGIGAMSFMAFVTKVEVGTRISPGDRGSTKGKSYGTVVQRTTITKWCADVAK